MNTKSEHPVWDVYDQYRTARLNVYYRESQLSRLQSRNFYIELVLALSTSSVVAGLWLWEAAIGGIIWKALATLAAILAVVKPLVKLSDQIQQKSKVLANWRLLDAGLEQLTLSVSQYRKYDDAMRSRFFTLMETKSTIIKEEPAEGIDQTLRKRCQEQVNQELPMDSFFIPED